MKTIIEWKTGTPTNGGRYLIVTCSGVVTTDLWSFDSFQGKMEWVIYRNDEIQYWCEIESISVCNKTE